MPIADWLAFAGASTVLLAIPGPTVLMVVSYALGHGRRVAWATSLGVVLGDLTSMTASMLGLGVVLSTSAHLFTAVKWVGAAYLIFLGIKLWRAPAGLKEVGDDTGAASPSRILLHAYTVTALNPKTIFFFVAFVPQFMTPGAPLLPQVVILEATFAVLALLNSLAYAWLASSARRAVRTAAVQRIVNRTGGSLLIGAGLLAAVWRNS